MDTDPTNTTIGDLCTSALFESGAFSTGQNPRAVDINNAWKRMQWMLQQWYQKRYLVYHLVNLAIVSKGQVLYTVGPGGDIDTGSGSVRPTRVESAFVRQLQQPGIQFQSETVTPNNVDYTLEILQSRQDYDKITLKNLQAGPGEAVWIDADWPLSNLYVWPVPQANIYEIHISIKEQLPTAFPTLATAVSLPYEYYGAILYNLAMRLRSPYRIMTFPGDMLPGLAKEGLAIVRGPASQIAKLRMPSTIRRRGLYNIFSDRSY